MENNQFIYIALDGDNAGRMVGRSVLANDEQGLNEVSARIDHGQDIIKMWAESNGGTVISSGGDEANLKVPPQAMDNIEQLRADYQFATQLTMTVGVGSSLSEAGKSLMAGKFRGKDQIVQYEPGVEQELQQAQSNVSSGSGTDEEKKITEAYLNKEEGEDMAVEQDETHNCKYCQEAEGALDSHDEDCQYCAEHDAAQASESDCKYCQEADAEQSDHEHSGDDCQYCQEAEANAEAEGVTHEHSGDDCQYCAEANAQESQGEQNEEIPQEGQEASQEMSPDQEIVDEITQQVPEGQAEIQDPSQIIDELSPGNAPVSDEMEDNVSRPEGYSEQNTPNDMGLAEDEVPEESPDLGEVLKDGLDSHADNIQREKIVGMVSQALEGFKANKAILEKAKEQAPALYESTIAMLKAMIEMAKMLGLGQQRSEDSEGPIEAQGEEVTEEPQQNPAAAQEDVASPAPQQ